jgi:hypothetical protein
MATHAQTMPRQVTPELLREARHDQLLAYMIKKGIPLTREKYISMAYLGHPPEPWTAAHEGELPEAFQHDPPETVD